MKIVIITQEDPFYMPIFFDCFFKELKKAGTDIQVVGVVVQNSLGKKSILALIWKMVDFYGIFIFVLQLMKYLWRKIVTLLNEAHLLPRSYSIEYFVKKNDCKILPYRDVNSEQFINFIKQSAVDLVVSVAASQIFQKTILNSPRLGCINIHNAPLPNYRGMLPSFWQMFFGEEYSVMTIHEMVESLDGGRIILQDKIRIEEGMTLDELIKATKRKSAIALVRVLETFKNATVQYKAPPSLPGSYYSFPTKYHIKEFKKRGYRII